MPAAKFDFTENHRIEQGVDFSKQFVWKNNLDELVDLTGFSARMQFRKTKAAPEVLLELSTENGGISLGGSAGTITLIFNKADTVGVSWGGGVHDLELVDPTGKTLRFIEGEFELSKEVTRG